MDPVVSASFPTSGLESHYGSVSSREGMTRLSHTEKKCQGANRN